VESGEQISERRSVSDILLEPSSEQEGVQSDNNQVSEESNNIIEKKKPSKKFSSSQNLRLSNIMNFLSTQSSHSKASFYQFCLLSVTPEAVAECIDMTLEGPNYLDPFYAKPIVVLDEYPKVKMEKDANLMFTSFCFPNGCSVRLIPVCALEGAKRLGWAGDNYKYQVQRLTDESGTITHGVSITISEIIPVNISLEKLKTLREERKATRTLVRHWRRYQEAKGLRDKWNTRRKVKSSLRESFQSMHQNLLDEDNDSVASDPKPISGHVKVQAFNSYNTMIENEKLGEVCVREKCYILRDVKAEHLSLMLSAFKQLIDIERQRARSERDRVIRRHALLDEFQTSLNLNYIQARVKYPSSELEHINTKKEMFEYSCESLLFPKISLPLPLPQVMYEWGLGTLVLKFQFRNVVKILMLLLVEKSVLVIGDKAEEVTTCACTLLDLLRPYQWSSVFIPLLPNNMLEFLESPVPFVAGLVLKDRNEEKFLVNDPTVRWAKENGVSILNFVAGKIQFTEEPESIEMLEKYEIMLSHLNNFRKMVNYEKRLTEMVESNKENSALLSFEKFFMRGATPHESLILNNLLKIIKKFITNLAGEIDSHNAWKGYATFDSCTNEFEFCSDLLIEPAMYHVEFLEKLTQTQHFINSFDRNKTESKMPWARTDTSGRVEQSIATLINFEGKQKAASSIADFVCQHWKFSKKLQQSHISYLD